MKNILSTLNKPIAVPDVPDDAQGAQSIGGLKLAAQGTLAEQETAYTPFVPTPGHRGQVSIRANVDNQLG